MICYSSRGDEASRRYFFRMLFASIFYTVTVFGINWIAEIYEPTTAWLVLLGILPVLPAGLMLISAVSFIRSRDEVYQRMFTEAALIAAGVVGLASFTWGFIEAFVDAAPDISMVWILPALVVIQSAVMPLVRRRYGTSL